ncbi:hypothetical protein [Streptomyces sp. NPDC048425]|uniref:hypothetical protein n=1 Tax=Streptomyces sp. NPDC048425 TaxID=3365548 RepID=UPI00370FE589
MTSAGHLTALSRTRVGVTSWTSTHDAGGGDDGESPMPKWPPRGLSNLPPILPWWGGRRRG